MTIRNRLTLVLSLTFGIVFTIAAVLVYYAFYTASERIIFSELRKTGLLSAMFYLEEDELSAREHNRIRSQFDESILNTDVKVYDTENLLTFGNGQWDGHVTPAVLDRIRDNGQLSFKADDHYYYGIFYPDNQGDFVVVTATSNDFFASQSNQLLLMMVVALIFGLLVIFMLSFWLSRKAYQPITDVIHQINGLDADTLDQSLTLPETRDELYELIRTFNGLLQRLSETFVIQKNFINYVSHEFKTPMAAIAGNLEVFAQKDRTPEEYRGVADKVVGHVGHMEQLLDNLMLLAGLRRAHLGTAAYRADELLWTVLDGIYREWPEARHLINLTLDVDDARMLSVRGSSGQMEIVLFNLIENAVKYADGKPIGITLSRSPAGALALTIRDHGKGIPSEELPSVHQPFFRGSNVGDTRGSGIGLSLAVLLCKQQGVSFSIQSDIGQGTQINLAWPTA